MGFRLNVKGQGEEILLEKESILDVKFLSESPDDSNARATDLGIIIEIKGNSHRFSRTRRPIDATLKDGISDWISAGIIISFIVSPAFFTEIRGIWKPYTRRKYMSYRLDFAVFPEF